MSRSRHKVDILRQISAIRAISAKLAKAKCATAKSDVRNALDNQKLEADHLDDVIGGWENAMNSHRFDPETSKFWSHAVNQGVLKVKEAIASVSECKVIQSNCEKHMAEMIANERCADALLSKARKKYLSDAENRNLAEQADQITRLEMYR